MGLVSSCVPTLRLRPDYAGETEKPTISGHFGFAFQENHVIIVTSSAQKISVFKIPPV